MLQHVAHYDHVEPPIRELALLQESVMDLKPSVSTILDRLQVEFDSFGLKPAGHCLLEQKAYTVPYFKASLAESELT